MLALYGPLSASQMAFNDQYTRLKALLAQQQLSLPLGKGALEKVEKKLGAEISELIDELTKNYPLEDLIPNIIASNEDFTQENHWMRSREIHEYLGLETDYENPNAPLSFHLNADGRREKGVEVVGFQHFYSFDALEGNIENNIFLYSGERLDLTPHLEQILAVAEYGYEYTKNTEAYIIDTPKARFVFTTLQGEKKSDGEVRLSPYVDGYLLQK